jgi:hypothetical protein
MRLLRYKQTVFWFLSAFILITATTLCAEAGLWGLALLSWRADQLTRNEPLECFVHDARGFIARGNPHCPEHDVRGYRNPSALSEAEIVTLGDSWTYGLEVPSDASWPRVLSHQLHRQVYNMALPESGPLQNRKILGQALELHPKIVIFGFYFGNDLLDDFVYAQTTGRLAEFLSPKDIADIDEVGGVDSLEHKAYIHLNRAVMASPPQQLEYSFGLSRIRRWLAKNSRLYGFLRSIKNIWFDPHPLGLPALDPRYEDAVAGISEGQRPYVEPFSEGGWKTIFTTPWRLAAVDLSDIRVRAGLSIANQAMLEMNRICNDNRIHFIVVLQPTKETIFWAKTRDPSRYNRYGNLVVYENKVRVELKNFFKENHIDFVDPLSRLQKSDVQPSFENADGHPNIVGQKLIGDTVYEFIRQGLSHHAIGNE